jgi:predicted PurR-regulated permease PerM
MALLVATGVTVYQQSLELLGFVQKIAQNGPGQYLQKPMQFGVWLVDPKVLNLDLDELTQQALIVVQGIVSSMAQYAGTFAQMAIGWFGSALIIFVLSIYFAIDLPRFGSIMSEAVHQPGYRRDVEQLLTETGRIWNAYLRGQTTLAVIVGIIVSIGLTVLGVNNALALGLLAGILDFIPFLGPAVVIGLSTLVALFQGSNWLGLNSFFYALIVLVFGIIVQQIEGNWLNPRIMGGALGLHPLLIVVGVIMGSTIAGILGVILAAPVMATTKLLGTYIWRKMFDLKPFPENVEHETLKRET